MRNSSKKIVVLMLVFTLIMAVVMPTLVNANEPDDSTELDNISTINITVTPPKVGSTIVDENTKPVISLGANANCYVSWTMYIDGYPSVNPTYDAGNVFGSNVVAGEEYYLEIYLMPNEGFQFVPGEELNITVNGGDEFELGYCSDNQVGLFTKVKAEKTQEQDNKTIAIHVINTEKLGTYTATFETTDKEEKKKIGVTQQGSAFYSVPEGNEITLTATPNDGNEFVSWYYASEVDTDGQGTMEWVSNGYVSSDATYSFVPTEDVYLMPVFKTNAEEGGREADQIQIWSTDGGKVAAKFTIDEPNPYNLKSKDGTDFKEFGEVVQYYKGMQITAIALPDDGYKFIGWYNVNIDAGLEDQRYEGDVIATTKSYTYAPGVTVVNEGEEPLRYVCAVFEEGEEEIASAEYTILSQPEDPYIIGSGTDYTIKASGEAGKFVKGVVDKTTLNGDNSIVTSGSTVLTLKSAFLDTLEVGVHKLTFVYEDGEVSTEFKVAKAEEATEETTKKEENKAATNKVDLTTNPQTGDAGILICISILAITGLGYLVTRRVK